MSTRSQWEREAACLAKEWQPLFVDEVIRFFAKRSAALNSDKAAFVDTYERFFLNPNMEGTHQ